MNILSGDIGGTKTILALFSREKGPRQLLDEAVFSSGKYASFEEIVSEFLEGKKARVESASFGVAGPIIGEKAQVTNLKWAVDGGSLRSRFHWESIHLINDLEAIAYSLPILEKEDLHTLNPGKRVDNGCQAVVAPGTGLGEACITFEGGTCHAHPSEGGHASFAPTDALQMGLLAYLKGLGHHHVSFERVCSGGLGIPNLYAYLKTTGMEEPAWLAEQLGASDDPTPVIVTAALDASHHCSIATETLSLFVSILGAETGNLALKVLSTGGIYLGGGIPPRILSALEKPAFLEAMRSKGRFRGLLTNMPVHVIMNSRAGLLGAAAFGLKECRA
jgi:glucokinase